MEFRKLTENKKILVFLLFMIVLVFSFYFKWKPKIAEQDSAYSQTYKMGIERVLENAENMRFFSIFSEEDSFTERNIDKTEEDFMEMTGIHIQSFSYEYLEAFFSFNWVNIALIIMSIIGAIAFSEKKVKGMLAIIHSSVGGRQRLVIRRCLALFLFNAGGVIVLKGILFLICALRFQGDFMNDLGYSIQSIPSFQMFTGELSIGQFLLLDAASRICSGFLLSLLIWTVLYVVDNVLSALGILGGIGITEYFLYVLIKPGDRFEQLHYCNLFYSIKDVQLWKEYKNLNFFSHPVSTKMVMLSFQVLVILILLVISITYGGRKYPEKGSSSLMNRLLRGMTDAWMKVIAFVQERLGLFSAEIYKLFLLQKGFIVFSCVIVLIIWFNPVREIHFMGAQGEYNAFVEQYEHEPDEKSYAYIKALKEENELADARYMAVVEAYDRGEATAEEKLEASIIYDSLEYKRTLYELLTEQTDYLNKLQTEKGIKGWYVNSMEFQMLFQKEKALIIVLIMFGLALVCGVSAQEERKSGMFKMMHSTLNGRKRILMNKVVVTGLFGMIFYLLCIFIRFRSVALSYGLHGFDAPVQSVPMLTDVPFQIDLRTYCCGYFGCRILLVLCVTSIMAVIGIFLDARVATVVSFALGVLGYLIFQDILGLPLAVVMLLITVVTIVFAQSRWKGSNGIRY